MIVQEPVQAAIWHCLNHYDYTDAVFLSERLYAEVKTDDSLFLLATAYYRNGQKDHAYHILKDRTSCSTQCRYLLGICAYDLQRYAEAEAALLQKNNSQQVTTLDEIVSEYGEQASFALALLGNIAAKTERKTRAIDAWKRALKLNPFQWSSFESLCKIGDKPNPQNIFQINDLENLSMCHGSNINNIESVIITNTPNNDKQQDVGGGLGSVGIGGGGGGGNGGVVGVGLGGGGGVGGYLMTPQQILANFHPNNTDFTTLNNSKLCTPEQGLYYQPICMSGFAPIRHWSRRYRPDLDSSVTQGSPQPTFGHLFDNSIESYSCTPTHAAIQPKLTESNNHLHQSLGKRMKAQVDQFINRKEPILQNCKPVFSQSTNVAKSPTISLVSDQNVRRSSRLFSNSYSVKENNKSPNRNKFTTPKSPSRKTKQRLAKCNLNKNTTYAELNTRNRCIGLEKAEKTETVTTTSTNEKTEKGGAIHHHTNNHENCLQQAILMQKQSAEGLMCLLKNLGQAYLNLSNFNCKATIDELSQLPPNQLQTPWVYSLLGLAHFELTDFDTSVKYFSKVHNMEPYRLEFMDIYSTALWHLQKEVALSALAQDLIKLNKNSPITWCVNGNCFSLHKEHDTAIKFFQRAVQVDPNFPYAYTLLGHEYITTEELDKAMSCFRNAIRLDSRHYNAWFGIGTIYSKQERYHLAKINYTRALSINPESSVILCHIGVVQHALKETEKALNTFNVAITKNPKDALCKFHRGFVYFALGRHAEALRELEELKEIVPKESKVYYLIGKIHKKLGNTDLALMHFSWATDLDPKGASSQIKEAFDPSIGKSTGAVAESPATPVRNDLPIESTSGIQVPLNYAHLPEDSEDSF